jgi:hypothetical protein
MSHNITRRPVGDSGCPYTGLESEIANPTRPSSPTIPASPSVESETADITRPRSPSISSPPSSPLTTQPRNGSSTVTPEDDVGDGTPDASNATTNKDEHMDKRSHATSQWKVDWKTPSLLIASYFAGKLSLLPWSRFSLTDAFCSAGSRGRTLDLVPQTRRYTYRGLFHITRLCHYNLDFACYSVESLSLSLPFSGIYSRLLESCSKEVPCCKTHRAALRLVQEHLPL